MLRPKQLIALMSEKMHCGLIWEPEIGRMFSPAENAVGGELESCTLKFRTHVGFYTQVFHHTSIRVADSDGLELKSGSGRVPCEGSGGKSMFLSALEGVDKDSSVEVFMRFTNPNQQNSTTLTLSRDLHWSDKKGEFMHYYVGAL